MAKEWIREAREEKLRRPEEFKDGSSEKGWASLVTENEREASRRGMGVLGGKPPWLFSVTCKVQLFVPVVGQAPDSHLVNRTDSEHS